MARKQKVEDWLSPEKQILVESWVRNGLSMDDLAYNMQVSKRTLYRWAKSNVTFGKLITEGKDGFVAKLENAMTKIALGYDYEETTIDIDGDKKHIRKVKKVMKPDERALEFLLKVNRPEKYARKEQVDIKKVELQLPNATEDNSSNLIEAIIHAGDPEWNKPKDE